MKDKNIKYGSIEKKWNAAGTKILKYTQEVYHTGLNEHKVVSAPDKYILENKVSLQVKKWASKWEKLMEKKKRALEKDANLEEAQNRTLEAQEEIKNLEDILIDSLNVSSKITWNSLKKHDKFPEPVPKEPAKYELNVVGPEPEKEVPTFTFFEKIFKPLQKNKIKAYEEEYSLSIDYWKRNKEKIEKRNKVLEDTYNNDLKKWHEDYKQWEDRKNHFMKEQENYNKSIDELEKSYNEVDPEAIDEYCEIVLNQSQYPDYFPQDFELKYNSDNRILIVEYALPAPDVLPNIKEVKYIASRKELKEYYLSKSALAKMYDDVVYKITLRTIYELFESDVVNAIEAISFNGWVKMRNASTGNMENTCILSVQVKKDEFLEINLKHVDPKQCFKSLKGVGSSKLSGITAIQPILKIDKTDKRFVQSHDVVDKLDDATNIAAMDWEEFEHLIREIFEREFTSTGGEVHVTQASRDGGVDAIAFDPDPIRGGKIVIQAKRYTNTVGVSAVRDLYGTVVNEGAIKGILVTTADYGPDAYNFAKDKPITLLNGGHLLHLLEKHGHKVKIDIKEAKKMMES